MRTMRKRDWLLLIAGVLILTAALGLAMNANAQTRILVDEPLEVGPITLSRLLTRNDVAPACRTYPQPEGCPALPWYELSYFVPLERQQQIVGQLAPVILNRLGINDSPLVNTRGPAVARRCFEVNNGYTVEIPCASTMAVARRAIRRPVRRL